MKRILFFLTYLFFSSFAIANPMFYDFLLFTFKNSTKKIICLEHHTYKYGKLIYNRSVINPLENFHGFYAAKINRKLFKPVDDFDFFISFRDTDSSDDSHIRYSWTCMPGNLGGRTGIAHSNDKSLSLILEERDLFLFKQKARYSRVKGRFSDFDNSSHD